MARPDFVTFMGGFTPTPMGQLMAAAHEALTLDLLERVRSTGAVERVFLVTDRPNVAAQAADVVVTMSGDPFHFGHELKTLAEKHRIRKLLYVGSGAAPLLTAAELASIAQQIEQAEDLVVTNNAFSADLIGLTPCAALQSIELPATDNPLPRLLKTQAGLPVVELPRTTATTFDIDTPTDLLVLRLHPDAGPRARAFLQALTADDARLHAAMMRFTDAEAEVIVAGRVGSHVMAYLQTQTACRERVFSEERGMQAAGRDRPGAVRSLLGFYIEAVGLERAFAALAEMGQAAFIDSRVIFYHLGLDPSIEDRFLSDLGQWTEVVDPVVRDFTRAAQEAAIPVVLGGHSLVSGGLMALVDVAWLEYDRIMAGTAADAANPAPRG